MIGMAVGRYSRSELVNLYHMRWEQEEHLKLLKRIPLKEEIPADRTTAMFSSAQIGALLVTDKLCNASVACNTLSIQATIFHRTDRSISVRKHYRTLKATALDPPGIRFA
jgi:hypothetical protein